MNFKEIWPHAHFIITKRVNISAHGELGRNRQDDELETRANKRLKVCDEELQHELRHIEL